MFSESPNEVTYSWHVFDLVGKPHVKASFSTGEEVIFVYKDNKSTVDMVEMMARSFYDRELPFSSKRLAHFKKIGYLLEPVLDSITTHD